MDVLQEMVNDVVSSFERYCLPFIVLIFTFISSTIAAIILPYRVAILVDDAQSQLNIIANILDFPFPKMVVGLIVIVLLCYFISET